MSAIVSRLRMVYIYEMPYAMPSPTRRKRALGAALVCLLSLCGIFGGVSGQAADDWPQGGRITCTIPWKAGGSADRMARQLISYWEPLLGSDIVVSNREGAATLLGTELFLRQPKDGSHIYIGTQLYLSAGIVLQGARFSVDDFALINFQQFDPITVAVRRDSPYTTFQELVDGIKARPGELKGGIIYGGAPHLAALFLQEKLGLDYRDVVFDSGAEYRKALVDGHVDFVFSNANGDRAIKAEARVLAVADKQRSGIWPEAPTFNEALGSDDFPRLGSARFIAVHREFKEAYPERFEKLVETYRLAFENPEYARLRESSGEAEVSSYRGPEESDAMNKRLHELLEQYKDILKTGRK